MHINVVTVAKLGDKINLDNKYILMKICIKIKILISFKGIIDPQIFH